MENKKRDNDISLLIHHNTILAIIIIISQFLFTVATVLFFTMSFINWIENNVYVSY